MGMARKLSRRRYSEATRYLKALIGDERQPHRMRIRAVESLMAIYMADDRAQERADAKDKPQPQPVTAAPVLEPDTVKEETVDQFIARVRGNDGGGNE